MKINDSTKNATGTIIGNIIIALVNPALGLLVSVKTIFYDKFYHKSILLNFAFCWSLILIYNPLYYDTMANFNTLQHISLNSPLYELTGAYFYLGLIKLSGLNYMTAIGITIFVAYSIVFLIFLKYSTMLSYHEKALFLLMIFFMIVPRNILDTNRFFFASLVVLIPIILKPNIYKILIFIALAHMLHSGTTLVTLPALIIFILSKLHVVKRLNNRNIIISLLLAISVNFILIPLASLIVFDDVEYSGRVDAYFSSEGANMIRNSGALYLIRYIGSLLGVYITYIILKCRRNLCLDFYTCLFLASSFMLVATFSFWILNERIAMFNLLLGSIIFLREYSNPETKGLIKRSLKKIVVCYFLLWLISVTNYSRVIYADNYGMYRDNAYKNVIALKPLYYPTLFLLDVNDYGNSDSVLKEIGI